jgi:hypothetical protein
LVGREAILLRAIDHVLDKSIAMFLGLFFKTFMKILILRTNHIQKKTQEIRVLLHKIQRTILLEVKMYRSLISLMSLKIWRLMISTR